MVEINLYEGRLGYEQLLGVIDASEWPRIPSKGELIGYGDYNTESDRVYKIINVLTDCVNYPDRKPEQKCTISLFVKEYEWE